jgi:DNA-directed RNA polymerase subunit M/transcription elongation factor TFIIS
MLYRETPVRRYCRKCKKRMVPNTRGGVVDCTTWRCPKCDKDKPASRVIVSVESLPHEKDRGRRG